MSIEAKRDVLATLVAAIESGRRVKDLDARGSSLRAAKLDGLEADFLDAGGADLTGASLQGAHLMDCDFPSAVLENADFTGATLWQCKLREADARGCRFQGVHAENNFFNRADFSAADFSAARLADTSFFRATLRRACLDGAEGDSVTFREADLREASLAGASLPGADFRQADLSGADLSGSYLHGADLTGARLDGVRWQGTDLTGAQLDGPAPDTQPSDPAPAAEMIAGLLGTNLDELRTSPEKARANLLDLFAELAAAGTGGGEGKLEASRRFMRRIRTGLQAQGVEISAELDELPDRLHRLVRDATSQPEKLGEHLRYLAGLFEARGDEADLDAVAESLAAALGPLVGQPVEADDERLQEEYRASARRAIADSLREVGLEPLAGERDDAGREEEAVRELWAEFEHSAPLLRHVVASGDSALAAETIEKMLAAAGLSIPFDLALESTDAVLLFRPRDALAAARVESLLSAAPEAPGWKFRAAGRGGSEG